ncbi:ParB/RepB/Spo0J family partition protein [Stenomitos frigidus]|uniref:Chromosome partitioning protein ParB n=1 Tax=Stenomitos frigidus ULC18 TaxID=2107698 RepID=A0A2T1ESE8_9CYAN|nr:ParB/RepB/Spo0J family partition protein [Stenomitos frigidus]PSB35631.1 chromosome partitioning protein ParB [Stenomitos frigidus ULC18]
MARRSLSKLRDSLDQVETQSGGDRDLPLTSICLPAQQPRRYFDPEKLEQLTLSVKEHGILEPVLVRPVEGKPDQYELVAGERRYRAAQQLKLTEIPVVIRHLSDTEALQLALVENLQREDLNPVEETEGILQLLSIQLNRAVSDLPPLLHRLQHERKKSANNVVGNSEIEAIESVFTGLGLMSWESFVNHRLPLLNLPDNVLEALRQGKLAYTKAQTISRVKDETQRQVLLQSAIKEDLSLSQIRERIKALQPEADKTSPKATVESLSRRVIQAKLWEDPKKWKQAQALLIKLEALISEE